MPDLKISDHPHATDPSITVVVLDGSIDAYNSELLSTRLDRIIEAGKPRIIVDCARLKFISSAGMGVFLAVEDDILDKNGGLKFSAVPPAILNVFQKVGIADVFRLYDTDNAAATDFGKGV